MKPVLEAIPLHLVKEPRDAHRLDHNTHELMELADDIKANGLINAIDVRPDGGFYEIIAGHRRYLAHKMMSAPTILANVHTDADDARTERIRFAENNQRADLSPMEEAIALDRMKRLANEPLDKLAHMVHRSIAWVRNRLDLLALPDDLKDLLHSRQLTIAHANLLGRVTDAPQRVSMTRYIIDSGANAEITRQWVHEWENVNATPRGPDDTVPPIPPMPQEIVIMLPCAVCGERHDHRQMHIERSCGTCHVALQTNRGNA